MAMRMPLMHMYMFTPTTSIASARCKTKKAKGLHLRIPVNKPTYLRCAATLITDPGDFEVRRLIGTYGFMNITSYSPFQARLQDSSEDDLERFRTQDIVEGSVKIRLYDGRIARGPLRGTSVYFKVYPGRRAAAIEADMMAANELEAHAFLQEIPRGGCQNLQILLGGFETETGEQWLVFRNNGRYSAADYAKFAGKQITENFALGQPSYWGPNEGEQTIKHRQYFINKMLQGIMKGLVYMHDHDRLHQSLGPASVFINTMIERDADYLIPRLGDLAFSVDIGNLLYEESFQLLSEGLWRRAAASGAMDLIQKRAFGIADDIYGAGLLFAYLAFVPFCGTGIMDSFLLQRLLEDTFQLDLQATREYCLEDDRLLEAVRFLDLGDGAGWELIQAMLNSDYRKRPVASTVLNHRFLTGAILGEGEIGPPPVEDIPEEVSQDGLETGHLGISEEVINIYNKILLFSRISSIPDHVEVEKMKPKLALQRPSHTSNKARGWQFSLIDVHTT